MIAVSEIVCIAVWEIIVSATWSSSGRLAVVPGGMELKILESDASLLRISWLFLFIVN